MLHLLALYGALALGHVLVALIVAVVVRHQVGFRELGVRSWFSNDDRSLMFDLDAFGFLRMLFRLISRVVFCFRLVKQRWLLMLLTVAGLKRTPFRVAEE